MYKYRIILILFSAILAWSCQEPSGLDTERLTRVLDSTKVEKKLITPTIFNTSVSENVEGILAFSLGQDSTAAIIINEEYPLDHSIKPNSAILIDTTGGVIRYTGNFNVELSDTNTSFLPGNLSLQRFTRLQSIRIKLDSLSNNIDISNPGGLQRKDVQVEFISYTNGTGIKQSYPLTSLLVTTVPILDKNLSILKFEGIISLNNTISYRGYTISKFRCNFDLLLSW